MTLFGRVALALAITLVVSSCSSEPEQAAQQTTTTTTAPATPTTTTAAPEVITTILPVPAEELSSPGSITIGEVQYDFLFECFAAGAGDVLALGVGQEPDTRQMTQAVVQMFFGQPYVSVLINDERLLELAVDAPAEIFLQAGVLSGSALRFVEASGTAGEGEAIGLGTVNVECSSFLPGLPEDYDVS